MQLEWTDSGEAFADRAASHVAACLAETPAAAIALPTGSTPIGLYARLRTMGEAGELALAAAHYFNLDEYVGVAPTDRHSFAAFLRRHILDEVDIPAEHIRLLRGDAPDIAAEAAAHDAAVAGRGGLDLAILGLGANGHIAFNEPGAAWDTHTHVVELSAATRERHAAETGGGWRVPTHGITLGIASILAARRCLLLIAGAHKAAAKASLFSGREDPQWPVTSLLRARDLTVIELCEPATVR